MLSKEDALHCKEIAREIIREVLIEHIASCPHGKTVLASKMFLAGVCIGSGFAGGSLALGLAKLLIGS